MQRQQIGPVDVNGGVHTARKQHQRKNVRICARVLCGLGLEERRASRQAQENLSENCKFVQFKRFMVGNPEERKKITTEEFLISQTHRLRM